jgi:hypothetical protein
VRRNQYQPAWGTRFTTELGQKSTEFIYVPHVKCPMVEQFKNGAAKRIICESILQFDQDWLSMRIIETEKIRASLGPFTGAAGRQFAAENALT